MNNDDAPAAGAVLEGRWVRLRPVEPSDYLELYRMCQAPELSFRWRFGASSMSYEAFCTALWDSIHVQLVMERRSDGAFAGLHVAYATSFRDRITFLGSIVEPRFHRSVWSAEGGGLFIEYLFSTFAFRKIYGEVVEYNLQQFETGINKLFVEEARYKDHVYHAGRFWDKRIYALYAERWKRVQLPSTRALARKARTEPQTA